MATYSLSGRLNAGYRITAFNPLSGPILGAQSAPLACAVSTSRTVRGLGSLLGGLNITLGSYPSGAPVQNTLQISGNVQQYVGPNPTDTVALIGCTVKLFTRRSAQYVDTQLTDASGNFTFSYLPVLPEGYFAVAFDPAGPPNQNAIILDKLLAA